MHTQAESLVSLTDPSRTDVILALCASGHFGVREAIAAATRQELRRLGSAPSDASASSMFQPRPNTSGTASFPRKRRQQLAPVIARSVSDEAISVP